MRAMRASSQLRTPGGRVPVSHPLTRRNAPARPLACAPNRQRTQSPRTGLDLTMDILAPLWPRDFQTAWRKDSHGDIGVFRIHRRPMGAEVLGSVAWSPIARQGRFRHCSHESSRVYGSIPRQGELHLRRCHPRAAEPWSLESGLQRTHVRSLTHA